MFCEFIGLRDFAGFVGFAGLVWVIGFSVKLLRAQMGFRVSLRGSTAPSKHRQSKLADGLGSTTPKPQTLNPKP